MKKIIGCPNHVEGKGCEYSAGLQREMENFQNVTGHLIPTEDKLPHLEGIDFGMQFMPLNDIVGGDLIIPIDFQRDFDLEARVGVAKKHGKSIVEENLKQLAGQSGFLLVDVSGHNTTDAALWANLFYAFKVGISYELFEHGMITPRLFEIINHTFHNPDQEGPYKFMTMLYAEISRGGIFKFVNAGHPDPVIYSREYDEIVQIDRNYLRSSLPLGLLPSKWHIDVGRSLNGLKPKDKYVVNTLKLASPGDTLLLYTDGLSEHYRKGVGGAPGEEYFPDNVERVLRETRNLSAKQIATTLKHDMLGFTNPSDDISYVVIKRKN